MVKHITPADVSAYIGRTPILKYIGKLIKPFAIKIKPASLLKLAGRRVASLPLGAASIQLTGSAIKDNLYNAKVQFETLHAAVKRFHPDGIGIIGDLTVEAEACGCNLLFPENGLPGVKTHIVKKKEDIAKLKIPDPYHDGRMPVIIETIRLLTRHFALLIGAGGCGPYSMAGALAGEERVALATIKEPDFVELLLEYCTGVIINYNRAQVKAGANVIVISEPSASILSPKTFQRYVVKYIKQITNSLDCPVTLHICGDSSHLIEKMCECGVEGISVDAPVDIVDVASRIPKGVVLVGNLDPIGVMLEMDKDGVREATLALLDKMRHVVPYMPMTGCDPPPETPIENIEVFFETVKNYR